MRNQQYIPVPRIQVTHKKIRRGSFIWWLPRLLLIALLIALTGWIGEAELTAKMLSRGLEP